MTNAYGAAHRTLRKKELAAHGTAGCEVCGRHPANPRTGKRPGRLHMHHRFGRCHNDVVFLCATCHSIVTALAGHARKVFESPAMMRKLRSLVRDRIHGFEEAREADN